MRSLGRDLLWGWGLALFAAVFCSAIVGVGYLLHGDRAVRELGLTMPETIGGYIVMGVVGGGILGLCRPLVKRALGRALTTFLVAVPITTISLGLLEPEYGTKKLVVTSVVIAAFATGPVMFALWVLDRMGPSPPPLRGRRQ